MFLCIKRFLFLSCLLLLNLKVPVSPLRFCVFDIFILLRHQEHSKIDSNWSEWSP